MYRVIHGFEDLKTGIFYDIGAEICTDEPRIQEFIDAGVIEKMDINQQPVSISEDNESNGTQEEITSNETSIQEEDFEKMTVKEIKEQLHAREIEFDDKAKKKDLIELLERAE